ncbi:DUF58 domain-containing protein [Tessaracoccus antarcticus]|uniref:DUF58 domain-containing protein n=1 Tax=Tessaracoccus antarcticus TaxID=2479848 RepID=UPI001314665E|nr:DUF58 domain-containing protein [Tessaracoccus antarcticus]
MAGQTLRLTGRGLALLIVGVIIIVAAAWVGEPDLVWLGFLLLGLPLVGLLLTFLLRPQLRVTREITPPQVPIGERPRTELSIENSRFLSFSSLEFRDTCPGALGAAARFALAYGVGRWHQSVGYEVRAEHRGHFELGPLDVTHHDPFGLARCTWEVPGNASSLRVTPRVWNLTLPRRLIGSGSSGDSTPQRIGHFGQDDVLVREHRHGDDLRRVHWRMTAKQGELMVRLEEHPWDPSVTLVVDNRSAAHAGSGPDGGFEWSISAVTSIAITLLASRCRITVVSAETEIYTTLHTDALAARETMMGAMVDLTGSDRPSLSSGLSNSDSMGTSQSIMAALGFLQAADAAALTAVGSRMQQASALVPDPVTWGVTPAIADAHRAACRLLTSSGWTLHHYGPDERVVDAWDRLMARVEAA